MPSDGASPGTDLATRNSRSARCRQAVSTSIVSPDRRVRVRLSRVPRTVDDLGCGRSDE